MESWTAALLPPPENTYPFVDDAGLLRTEFDIGIREQTQKWSDGWRTYTVEIALTAAEIRLRLDAYIKWKPDDDEKSKSKKGGAR